jgi:hypothetical protein
MSGFSKVITSGKLGSVEISESGGVASLKGTVSADIGSKFPVKVHNSTQIDLPAMDLAFAGLDMIEAKIPSTVVKNALEGLKKLIAAELPVLEEKLGGAPAADPAAAPADAAPAAPSA